MKPLRTASTLSLLILVGIVSVASAGNSHTIQNLAPTTGYTGNAFADLVVGVLGEDIPDGMSQISDAGLIHVIYGFPSGLGPGDSEIFHQNTAWAEDDAEAGDNFGSALASGDFNGDGNYDIAIGVPYEDIGTISQCGRRARDIRLRFGRSFYFGGPILASKHLVRRRFGGVE